MSADPGHCGTITAGEAEVAGEPVDVTISGKLRRVFAARGRWWAKVELGGAAADFNESVDVPLICVRPSDRLRRPVQAPAS